MAQVKIYGLRSHLAAKRSRVSDAIHGALMSALGLPVEKRFQRFLLLEAEDFVYPSDRSPAYIIVEVSMFEGRSVEAKKHLIMQLFERLQAEADIAPQDVEITLFETPRHHWGIRGRLGDALSLSYPVDV